MKMLALAIAGLLSLLGVLVWALRGEAEHATAVADPVAARPSSGAAPVTVAALEREPTATPRAVAEVATVAPVALPVATQPLPELAGERTWEQLGVGFFGGDLTEVAHLFVLENRGARPITFVSARVTTSTTLSAVEWPLVLAPGQRLQLELVNKLRVEQAEKTSRAQLVTDTGEIVTLTLLARAAR